MKKLGNMPRVMKGPNRVAQSKCTFLKTHKGQILFGFPIVRQEDCKHGQRNGIKVKLFENGMLTNIPSVKKLAVAAIWIANNQVNFESLAE